MCKSPGYVAQTAYELQILRKIQLICNQSFVSCRVTTQRPMMRIPSTDKVKGRPCAGQASTAAENRSGGSLHDMDVSTKQYLQCLVLRENSMVCPKDHNTASGGET